VGLGAETGNEVAEVHNLGVFSGSDSDVGGFVGGGKDMVETCVNQAGEVSVPFILGSHTLADVAVALQALPPALVPKPDADCQHTLSEFLKLLLVGFDFGGNCGEKSKFGFVGAEADGAGGFRERAVECVAEVAHNLSESEVAESENSGELFYHHDFAVEQGEETGVGLVLSGVAGDQR